MAVVVAQSAIEVLVRQVISERLQQREVGGLREYIISTIRTHTLKDDRTRKLWLELTGDEINRADVWRHYTKHVDRRHEIVHGGIEVSESETAASLDAVQSMIDHIEGLPPPVA